MEKGVTGEVFEFALDFTKRIRELVKKPATYSIIDFYYRFQRSQRSTSEEADKSEIIRHLAKELLKIELSESDAKFRGITDKAFIFESKRDFPVQLLSLDRLMKDDYDFVDIFSFMSIKAYNGIRSVFRSNTLKTFNYDLLAYQNWSEKTAVSKLKKWMEDVSKWKMLNKN